MMSSLRSSSASVRRKRRSRDLARTPKLGPLLLRALEPCLLRSSGAAGLYWFLAWLLGDDSRLVPRAATSRNSRSPTSRSCSPTSSRSPSGWQRESGPRSPSSSDTGAHALKRPAATATTGGCSAAATKTPPTSSATTRPLSGSPASTRWPASPTTGPSSDNSASMCCAPTYGCPTTRDQRTRRTRSPPHCHPAHRCTSAYLRLTSVART